MSESGSSGWFRFFLQATPLVKQLPTLAALLLAFGATLVMRGLVFTNLPAAIAGAVLILAATAYAAVLSVRGPHDGFLVFLIPIVDIIGFGLFRHGTGAAQSLFGALSLLPIVWLATGIGFRYVILVVVLSSSMVLAPFIWAPPTNPVDWLRGVISPLVFAAVAAVINDLSRQQRVRAEQAERLVAAREQAIARSEEMIAQLQRSEEQYRTLSDSYRSLWSSITAQAVIATGCDGRVEAWNPGAERLTGIGEAQALEGMRIDRIFPSSALTMLAAENPGMRHPHGPSDLPPGIQALFAQADASSEADGDLQIVTASGTIVPARVTVTPRSDGRGAQRGYLLVITDETRAVEVARMKDEFVGMISHELRTPLSAIIGFLDLLRNDPAQPLTAEQIDFVAIIERNAQRLLALVGDLLFTAQVESGRVPLDSHEIDIRESVNSAVSSATPHAQRQGIELVAEVPETPVLIAADVSRIGQALDNLISNAIKFTPSGGRVVAGVMEGDSAVVLFVRDDGIGIPADEQGMLFTRFFRASTATRNAVPGIGLGLTITRAIVLAHGGTMDVTSEEGKGTEFRISLPTAPRTQSIRQIRLDG